MQTKREPDISSKFDDVCSLFNIFAKALFLFASLLNALEMQMPVSEKEPTLKKEEVPT